MNRTTDITNRALATSASVLLTLAVFAAGCDSATVPAFDTTHASVGTIHVSAQQSGGDLDVDGFDIVVDSVRAHFPSDGTQDIAINAGSHTVALEGVADNCTVSGTYPHPVNVISGDTINVAVEIDCAATGIAVTTHTLGFRYPGNYQLAVSGHDPIAIGPTDSTTISRLQPGRFTISLIVPGDGCTVTRGNEITVLVTARALTPVVLDVECLPPARREAIAFQFDTTVGSSVQTWIGLIDPDGSHRRSLRRGNSPSWSPDGSRLVFSDAECDTSPPPGYDDFLYTYPCTGGLVVIDPETMSETRPAGGGGGFSPAWSRTGNELAFLHCCATPHATEVLSTLQLDTAAVAVPQGVAWTFVGRPTWSPGGRGLALICSVYDPAQLCVVYKGGGNFFRLTSDSVSKADPAWSPDGKRIAFTRDEHNIVFHNLDDDSTTPLTDGSQPAWSPDGTKLVFKDRDGLYTINADGSNRTRITTGNFYAPAWRP